MFENLLFRYTRNLPVNFSQVEEVADSDHTDVTQLAPASLSLYLNLVIDGALIVRLGRLAEPIRWHNALSKRNCEQAIEHRKPMQLLHL